MIIRSKQNKATRSNICMEIYKNKTMDFYQNKQILFRSNVQNVQKKKGQKKVQKFLSKQLNVNIWELQGTLYGLLFAVQCHPAHVSLEGKYVFL